MFRTLYSALGIKGKRICSSLNWSWIVVRILVWRSRSLWILRNVSIDLMTSLSCLKTRHCEKYSGPNMPPSLLAETFRIRCYMPVFSQPYSTTLLFQNLLRECSINPKSHDCCNCKIFLPIQVQRTSPLPIRSGQNHLTRHNERRKKTRQTEEVVGRQHQGIDKPELRWEQTSLKFAKSKTVVQNRGNYLWSHLWCPHNHRG